MPLLRMLDAIEAVDHVSSGADENVLSDTGVGVMSLESSIHNVGETLQGMKTSFVTTFNHVSTGGMKKSGMTGEGMRISGGESIDKDQHFRTSGTGSSIGGINGRRSVGGRFENNKSSFGWLQKMGERVGAGVERMKHGGEAQKGKYSADDVDGDAKPNSDWREYPKIANQPTHYGEWWAGPLASDGTCAGGRKGLWNRATIIDRNP